MHRRGIPIVLSLVAAMVALAVVVSAGNPDNPPGPPETTSSYRLEDIYRRLSTGAAGAQITFTEPISEPAVGTGHTLNEIMAVAPQVDATNGATTSQVVSGRTYWGLQSGAWGLQTGAAAAGRNVTGGDGQLTFAIPDGFYTGSRTAKAQDADLAAGNIAQGVDLFGVIGSAAVATGDATPADVLTGTIFSSASGSGLSGTMPNHGAGSTILPTTTNQSLAAGYWSSANTVQGDSDLAAGNIRSGANLFGVSGDPDVVNTASGDAAAGDVLSGRMAWVDGSELTGSMPNNGAVTLTPATISQTIEAGYHNGSGYVTGDADLVADNLKGGVSVFGVDGTLYAPVPKTGHTQCYTTTWDSATSCPAAGYPGQDGDYQAGVTWPTPRFITGTMGVVTDTLTGLVWLEDSNCFGQKNWATALSDANGLAAGTCDLTDDSSAGDWRLPNVREMHSLIDYGEFNPALPGDHPFTGLPSSHYWSSSTDATNPSYAWFVSLSYGNVYFGIKTSDYYVWPVRGGQ